jgi:16S rRNA C967 or C1407 C5-methylase (RsmB/RsmF family)/NOL1/NOP2/fmu family ribosome biogenesis protein
MQPLARSGQAKIVNRLFLHLCGQMSKLQHNIPKKLLESLHGLPGFDEERFVAAHQEPAPVSVRKNPYKFSAQLPNEAGLVWGSTVYLEERPSFTLDPLFHAGCYYVQEASSTFIGQVFTYFFPHATEGAQPLRILDLCAAPGGKSTDILSAIPPESLLVCNEVIRTRVNVLSENITKWGAANVIVTNNDPADFTKLDGYFDVILVDAPCSGSGLFRKDPDAIKEWSEENVEMCSKRQRRILEDVLPALKNGGLLLYSTCSYSREENETIADEIMQLDDLVSLEILSVRADITRTTSEKHGAAGYRFYPDKFKGEGLYMTAFRKAGLPAAVKLKSTPLKQISSAERAVLEKYVWNEKGGLLFFKHNDDIHFIHKEHEKDLHFLQQNLYVRNAGTVAGRIMNGELIPDHALALSNWLRKDVPRVSVDKITALKYLKREDIKLDGVKTGWILICFEDHPLGWAKVLPNRVNNYFPKEWRILKDIPA